MSDLVVTSAGREEGTPNPNPSPNPDPNSNPNPNANPDPNPNPNPNPNPTPNASRSEEGMGFEVGAAVLMVREEGLPHARLEQLYITIV